MAIYDISPAAIACEVHDRWRGDGWNFCDAIREVTPPAETFTRTAQAYLDEWGTLQDGYTINDFRELDIRERRGK